MKLLVGNHQINAYSVVESVKPTRDGMLETLQILVDTPLAPGELNALRTNTIRTEDGRDLQGYTEVDSISILLYRPNDVTRRRQEESQQLDTMRAMVKDMPDDMARKYAAFVPGMAYDGGTIQKGQRINWGGVLKRAKKELLDIAECAPNVKPLLWEDV